MPELRFSCVEEHSSRNDVLKKWLLRSAVAIAFLLIGKGKFEAHSEWITIFNRIGFGQWFRYFTGIVQVAGAVLVLVPRTFVVGILMLSCTMLGAMAAWIFFLGVPLAAVIPGAILGGLVLVGAEDLSDLASKWSRKTR
jgi:putative oxidoreductase